MMDFEPTEEESKEIREEVKKAFANARVVTREERIKECREILDKYCEQFGASSHYELLCWADGERDIPGDISCEILWAYAELNDVKIKYEEEGHGEKARKFA
ncbi:MAG: hypothetical protein OXB88_07190 [Bacteriovoracales bacterium]|nr:hypothetical protein [Bacteriovoracales bacterium]